MTTFEVRVVRFPGSISKPEPNKTENRPSVNKQVRLQNYTGGVLTKLKSSRRAKNIFTWARRSQ